MLAPLLVDEKDFEKLQSEFGTKIALGVALVEARMAILGFPAKGYEDSLEDLGYNKDLTKYFDAYLDFVLARYGNKDFKPDTTIASFIQETGNDSGH